MKKSAKELLFERMQRINPDFLLKENAEKLMNKKIKDFGEETDNDSEGAMYKVQLEEIFANAKFIYHKLHDRADLPAWVQDKIVEAKEALDGIAGFIKTGIEMHEGEEIEEGKKKSKIGKPVLGWWGRDDNNDGANDGAGFGDAGGGE